MGDKRRPAGMSAEDDDRLIAAAELVARTGARGFEIGYLHDDVPAAEAGWYASAMYRGARITAEERGPVESAEALAVRLLTGAKCACGKLVALRAGGALAFRRSVMSDGSVFTSDEARAAGQCLWRREGRHWVSACGLRAARRKDAGGG